MLVTWRRWFAHYFGDPNSWWRKFKISSGCSVRKQSCAVILFQITDFLTDYQWYALDEKY